LCILACKKIKLCANYHSQSYIRVVIFAQINLGKGLTSEIKINLFKNILRKVFKFCKLKKQNVKQNVTLKRTQVNFVQKSIKGDKYYPTTDCKIMPWHCNSDQQTASPLSKPSPDKRRGPCPQQPLQVSISVGNVQYST